MGRLRSRLMGCFLAATALALAGIPARGQGNGDYDDDGDVDGDDFWYWAGCMTGPAGGELPPGCEAFDFDLLLAPDGKVDLADFAQFGRLFTGSPCTYGRKYADVTKSDSATTGCSAQIRTRTPTLCGEPGAKSQAHSAAWAGVTKFEGQEPVKWAQMGYVRYRPRGSTAVFFRYYAETKAGPNPATDYELYLSDEPPSEGTHEYKCYLISSLFGTWQYEYDGLWWHTYTHNGWNNETGTHYQWEAEILNKEDQMVGTPTAKCDFTQCQYAIYWGGFEDADIAVGDLHTDDPNEWGIERTSATGFNVWDKNP
jgi:hypothetical protein